MNNDVNIDNDGDISLEVTQHLHEVNTHQLITVDNEWTPNLENLVKTWALQSVLQREMHSASAKKYRILSGRITIARILLTTLTSVGSFGAVDSQQYKIWMYV